MTGPAPESCPHQVPADVEAAVCEIRREHPKWGPIRIAHEVGRLGVAVAPSRMTVYRVLIRHGLIEPGTAIEVDRTVARNGAVHLAGHYVAPETRELLRTRPRPLAWDQARAVHGARPAGPPPRPSAEPVTAQRRASNTGVIMVAGQVVTVHVAAGTIDLDDHDSRIVRRTTAQPVRSVKAAQSRRDSRVS